ncbi:MAG: hypothetical protein CL772_04615 [Chloroflexi bacterium]|nr:hypothetical protein [Chloroflexota bacterium]|tara:strand:+ start:79238 stop:79432 length:195 start_codon:yes stop_codon:yes gene_type:complete
MFLKPLKQSEGLNHHGDSINPDFAKWITDFISGFSENLLIAIFIIGLVLFFTLYAFILFFSRKK